MPEQNDDATPRIASEETEVAGTQPKLSNEPVTTPAVAPGFSLPTLPSLNRTEDEADLTAAFPEGSTETASDNGMDDMLSSLVEDTAQAPVQTPPVTPPAAPVKPVAAFPASAPTKPQKAPESAVQETLDEPVTSPATTTPATTAASIENLAEYADEEEQKAEIRKGAAIHALPRDLKMSVLAFFDLLEDDTISEVSLNGHDSIGFKRDGQRFRSTEINFHNTATYHAIINDFLLPYTNTSDRIGARKHLIEGQLALASSKDPSKPQLIARVHIVLPQNKAAIITIAKKARTRLTVDDMIANGTLTGDMGQLLKDFAKARVTLVVSGNTGTGKTTLIEALSREFDPDERVILIEDIEELNIPVNDVNPLVATQKRPDGDIDEVTLEWLVRQALRMRGDRIIVGECRGPEMAEFLLAANSGADGSMTSMFALTPPDALNNMITLSLRGENPKSEKSIARAIASTIQVVVQLANIDGKHIVTHIEEVTNVVNTSNNMPTTETIYGYDRSTGKFEYKAPLSQNLQDFMKQRGVTPHNPQNFRR